MPHKNINKKRTWGWEGDVLWGEWVVGGVGGNDQDISHTKNNEKWLYKEKKKKKHLNLEIRKKQGLERWGLPAKHLSLKQGAWDPQGGLSSIPNTCVQISGMVAHA